MSVPVGSSNVVWYGSWLACLSFTYGFIQCLYILLRPSFSEACSHRMRLKKTAGFAASAVVSTVNLLVAMTAFRAACYEEVVQVAAASVALFHGGLFWAYTRIAHVFLPFKNNTVNPISRL